MVIRLTCRSPRSSFKDRAALSSHRAASLLQRFDTKLTYMYTVNKSVLCGVIRGERGGVEDFGVVRDEREVRSSGPTTVRRVSAMIATILGSVAGTILVVPLWVIAPFWIFVTVPQLIAAVFASSLAYLFASPARATMSRTMILSLMVATVLALLNLALFTGRIPGIVSVDDLALPAGLWTHFLEAVAIGSVAGVAATSGGQARQTKRLPLWIAGLLSALAIITLLSIGSSVLPVLLNP